VCVVLLVGVGVLAVKTGAAEEAAQCSVATLSGTYIFTADGVAISGEDKVPFALAGIEVYDGAGQVQGVLSSSTNGAIVRNVPFSGTYTVNANCTGTYTTTDSAGNVVHVDQFIAPDGSELTFVQTDPGIVAAGSERKGSRKKVSDLTP
jgi:hypothetical protein